MAIHSSRRSFMVLGASIASLFVPRGATAQQPSLRRGDFDMSWLDDMKGQHKQLYDFGSLDLGSETAALRFGRNFLDTFRDVYQLEYPAINVAVGISGPAFAMNASDRLWAAYKLGERSNVIDPATKKPATRNIFYDDGSNISIKALQARGMIFWQCNVALGGVAQQLAATFQKPVAEVRADLVAGLNAGVRLMPSHVMALALAQERGFTYMKP